MRSNFVAGTFFFLLSLFLLFAPNAFAQQPPDKTLTEKTFSFDYPSDWRLVDKSSPGVQQYNLVPPSGNVLIMLLSYDQEIPDYNDFSRIRRSSAEKLADPIFYQLNRTGKAKQENACAETSNLLLPGKKVTGFYGTEPSTAEIYYFALNEKFFNLIYIRNDKESVRADAVWNKLLSTFSFKNFNDRKPDFMIDLASRDNLNIRTRKLAVPLYPREATQFGAPDVTVRVVIDETGKVLKAKAAVKGSLASYAENAALDSQFEPMKICGKVTRTSGIIIYRGFDRR